MGLHNTLAKKYAGKPVLLVFGALGLTIGFLGLYKYAYKPWQKRRRLTRAEEYADFLYSKEIEK